MANTTQHSGLPDPTVHITSHDPKTGKAVVLSSTRNEWTFPRKVHNAFNVVYTTSSFPTSLNDEADLTSHAETMRSRKLGLVKPGGTVCRIVDFAPGSDPLMHRTQSLDYGVVLEGELDMALDDGSTTRLTRGDVAVQRGTMHAWSNPSKTEWARMLFVLQDCQPIILTNGERLKEDLSSAVHEMPKSGNDD